MESGFPQILHHGAIDGVTGSCHELVVDQVSSVLVDCGLFQGAERSPDGASSAHLEIDFDIGRVKALLVTHCHIDHVGRIPYLLAAGFDGPIYCSEPTAVLLPLVLEDAIKVGFTRDTRLVSRFLDLLKRRLAPVPYATWTSVLPDGKDLADLAVRFRPAGHILGSAYIECDIRHGASPTRGASSTAPHSSARRVLFSGDLGGPYTPLLPMPKAPYGTDILVLESTYGDRQHDGRKERVGRLKACVERCFADRGVILIPAFSIGRTQELLYELESIVHRAGDQAAAGGVAWRDLEVVVDSPLAARFTEAYRALREHWDNEARHVLAQGRHPLSFEQITTIDSHQDHLRTVQYLTRTARPTIVIAASGMCSGGRVVDYLKALLGDSRTDVLFVGYQAQGTPGRDIQTYGPRGGWVRLDGERYDIRAGIHTLSGYSAHADQRALAGFVKRMRRKPREIRLVHGSEQAKSALQALLRRVVPESNVVIP